MENQVITSVLEGNLDTEALLMLFIIGILTKRFVPWWVHEKALEKLQEYEDAAPELLDEVTTLIDMLNDDGVPEHQRRRVRERQETLHHVVRNKKAAPIARRRTRRR